MVLAAALALLALTAMAWAYARDMSRAYQRIQGRSQLLDTPLGRIEYTQRGQGPAVLVVHGSGGGFDQGEFLADLVLEDGYRVLTGGVTEVGRVKRSCSDGGGDSAYAAITAIDSSASP